MRWSPGCSKQSTRFANRVLKPKNLSKRNSDSNSLSSTSITRSRAMHNTGKLDILRSTIYRYFFRVMCNVSNYDVSKCRFNNHNPVFYWRAMATVLKRQTSEGLRRKRAPSDTRPKGWRRSAICHFFDLIAENVKNLDNHTFDTLSFGKSLCTPILLKLFLFSPFDIWLVAWT